MRAEVGPDARIVAANRVRKGGVGGFFAREAFEVLVEPAGAGTTAGSSDEARRPHRRAIAAHRADARPRARLRRRGHATAATRAPARSEGRAPTSILELADAVSDDERNDVIDLVEERSVSTESRDFAQVLDRFSRSIDATPEELAGEPDRPVEHRNGREEIDLRTPNGSADTATTTAPGAGCPPHRRRRRRPRCRCRTSPTGRRRARTDRRRPRRGHAARHAASAARRPAGRRRPRRSSTATRRACRSWASRPG